MESPQSWNLLTSSLAVSELGDSARTWSFLLLQGLVSADDPAREIVERSIAEVQEEGEITGPTMALRIADRLHAAGITTDLASRSDPWGEVAKARLAVVQGWNEPAG